VTTEHDEWPDELERAAAAHDLGPLVRWQRSDVKQAAGWGLALPFVAAAFLLVLGLVVPLVVDSTPGEVSWDGSGPLFIIALLLAAFGVFMLI